MQSSTNLGVWRRETELSRTGTRVRNRTVKLVVAGGFLIAGLVGAVGVYIVSNHGAGGDQAGIAVPASAAGLSAEPSTTVPSTTALARSVPTTQAASSLVPTSALAQYCSAGIVCWWDSPDFKNILHSIPHGEVGPVAPGNCLALGVATLGPRNASSISNATTVSQTLWENSDCTGESMAVSPGQQLAKVPMFVSGMSG
ncbi:hypothetical protein [Nocardia sp. NPDC004415]